MSSFPNRVYNSITNGIKSYDIYGEPIQLNYQGEDTYKTCPGGIISLIFLSSVFCYGILKFDFMFTHSQWSIV